MTIGCDFCPATITEDQHIDGGLCDSCTAHPNWGPTRRVLRFLFQSIQDTAQFMWVMRPDLIHLVREIRKDN